MKRYMMVIYSILAYGPSFGLFIWPGKVKNKQWIHVIKSLQKKTINEVNQVYI